MDIRWLTASLDFPAESFGDQTVFWRAITGSTVSPPLGEDREFAVLEPFQGDSHLHVQHVADPEPAVHLDLEVPDPQVGADEATALGAVLIDSDDTRVVLRSPAGLRFCLVRTSGVSARPRPIRWPGDTISVIDTVYIEVPADAFDDEVRFWSALTGWPVAEPDDDSDDISLRAEPPLALGLTLHRLTEPSERAHAHLDVAATSVPDEVTRHTDWGAVAVHENATHAEMTDPAGLRYFISARNPRTGAKTAATPEWG